MLIHNPSCPTPPQARAFLSLAGTMLEALGLPGEAATALGMAAGLRTWSAAPRELHVAHALALVQVGYIMPNGWCISGSRELHVEHALRLSVGAVGDRREEDLVWDRGPCQGKGVSVT